MLLFQPFDDYALRDQIQSACRAGHSTETVLMRVKNDIAAALHRKSPTILVLLDLSCAFDTINYDILLRRLEHSVGISGAALEWLNSYVSERYHQVAASSAKSSHCLLERDVPHGSVLGPLMYCVYTRPIGDIVIRHGLQYHSYADDTQIYVTVEKDVSIESALARTETCIIEVTAWMDRNDLKLNAEKSQAILFKPAKHRVNKQPEVCVEIAGHRIPLSTSVRNLGVVFDSRLSMEEQVAKLRNRATTNKETSDKSDHPSPKVPAELLCTHSSRLD